MGFLIVLGISLLSSLVLTWLVRPTPAGPANLNAVTPPTADKGKPVPVVFGTVKLAPNVIWWGNVHADQIRVPGSPRSLLNPFATNASIAAGYRYGADVAGAFCHGPIDELLDLMFEDTSLIRYNAANANYVVGTGGNPVLVAPVLPALPQSLPSTDNPVTFTINAPDLFGGDRQGGGVVGTCEFYYGKATQIASLALAQSLFSAGVATLLTAPQSNYKRICYFVMTNATFGTSPVLQNFYAVVRRCPFVVSPDLATSNINGSANPADVLYEMQTNAFWGLGLSPAMIDFASFRAAAVTLKAEGMGVDFKMDAQDTVASASTEVLRHIDGAIYTHPTSGLLTLKLFRADYVVADLPHATPSNVKELKNFKQNDWPSTLNEVRVTYLMRGTSPNFAFVNDTVPAQNLANMQATGQVASSDYSYPYFSNSDLALAAAFRILRVVSAPLAAGQLVLNRQFYNLTIGAVLVLDWPPLGIAGLIVRVSDLSFGTLDSNLVTATFAEDVFATAPTVYTAPAPTGWVAPTLTPVAAARALALPTPWFLVKADQFIGQNMVVRGSSASTSWDGTYNNDPTVPDSPVVGAVLTTLSPFCPAGTLVAIYPWNTAYDDEAGIRVTNLAQLETLLGTDAAGLARGDLLAWIGTTDGGEVIAWRDIIPQSDGSYLINGILRGQFDTVPQDHKAGETVYFFYPFGYTPYYPGQDAPSPAPPAASGEILTTSGYKLWAAIRGMVSSLPAGPPVAVIKPPAVNTPAIDPRRAVMPLPPGNTQLDGIKNNVIDPTSLLPDSNSLTWVGRNRLTQTTTLVHDAAGVAIEASETYEVDVRHVSKTTGLDVFGLLRTVSPATSPLSYSNHDYENDLTAANGGTPLTSTDVRRTGAGIRFLIRAVRAGLKSYDLAVPGFTRKQLTGYPIIPSLQFANIFGSGTMTAQGSLEGDSQVTGTVGFSGAGALAATGTVGASGELAGAGALEGDGAVAGTAIPPMDTAFLDAWYESDGAGNVLTGSRLDTWADLSGNSRNVTRSAGTPTQNANQIHGYPSIDFAGSEYFSNLSIPTEAGMTFFAVLNYTHISAYHNFFDTAVTQPACQAMLWFDSSNEIEADAESNPANKVTHWGVWGTLVIHTYNAGGGKLGFKLRWNGAQVAADAGVSTNTGAVPGVIGTPASLLMSLFNRSAGSMFHGSVASFGFYGRNKDGSEAALEAYLRAKYATW